MKRQLQHEAEYEKLSNSPTNAILYLFAFFLSQHSQVVEWLNNASISGSSTPEKIDTISKVQEVLLHTDSDLLEEFIDDVLVYSQDTNQDVRRAIVGFIEETW